MSRVVRIKPGELNGCVIAPPSKSVAHRAVIAAALAQGESCISNLELSNDIAATIAAVRALGAGTKLSTAPGGGLRAKITGASGVAGLPQIDCGESGSTLRFLLPVALSVSGGAVFTGSGRLGARPLGPYLDLFQHCGISVERGEGGFPLSVRGSLKPGRFTVPGNVSSQFITGLLLAAPLLGGPSEIAVEGDLESLPYVDITVGVLESFGVAAEEAERGSLYRIDPQPYQPQKFRVEGDWSQAALLLLMGLLGGQVSVGGLDRRSRQGDRVIEGIFRGMGGNLEWEDGILIASRSSLRGAKVDVSQCPDLAPAVAAAMAVAAGESSILGGKRLREKESDRIAAIASCLNGLGADAAETEDGMVIRGKAKLSGGVVDSFNDHRIAMMAAAVSPACSRPVILSGHEAVAKSWPGFWEVFKSVGGAFDEQPMG